MASLDELVLKAGDLRNVRLADYISKRSSAFTHGWNIRYTVLSGNFLFVYSTPQVRNFEFFWNFFLKNGRTLVVILRLYSTN